MCFEVFLLNITMTFLPSNHEVGMCGMNHVCYGHINLWRWWQMFCHKRRKTGWKLWFSTTKMKHKVICLSVFNPWTYFFSSSFSHTAVVQSQRQCLFHVILPWWEMNSSHFLMQTARYVLTLWSFHDTSGNVSAAVKLWLWLSKD